jgi:hypothetical protein
MPRPADFHDRLSDLIGLSTVFVPARVVRLTLAKWLLGSDGGVSTARQRKAQLVRERLSYARIGTTYVGISGCDTDNARRILDSR